MIYPLDPIGRDRDRMIFLGCLRCRLLATAQAKTKPGTWNRYGTFFLALGAQPEVPLTASAARAFPELHFKRANGLVNLPNSCANKLPNLLENQAAADLVGSEVTVCGVTLVVDSNHNFFALRASQFRLLVGLRRHFGAPRRSR